MLRPGAAAGGPGVILVPGRRLGGPVVCGGFLEVVASSARPGRTASRRAPHEVRPDSGAATGEYGRPGTNRSELRSPRPWTWQNNRSSLVGASGRGQCEPEERIRAGVERLVELDPEAGQQARRPTSGPIDALAHGQRPFLTCFVTRRLEASRTAVSQGPGYGSASTARAGTSTRSRGADSLPRSSGQARLEASGERAGDRDQRTRATTPRR